MCLSPSPPSVELSFKELIVLLLKYKFCKKKKKKKNSKKATHNWSVKKGRSCLPGSQFSSSCRAPVCALGNDSDTRRRVFLGAVCRRGRLIAPPPLLAGGGGGAGGGAVGRQSFTAVPATPQRRSWVMKGHQRAG